MLFVEKSNYQIDGVVITTNKILGDDPEEKYPEHSIALKNQNKSLITEVVEIEWNVSKHGVLKPRIRVKPICINGANIEWVTGNNARNIVTHNIGKGTILEIERSGDVIPNIKSIITPTKAELPLTSKWEWNKTNVDICIIQDENDIDQTSINEMKIKKIFTFFKELECPNLGPKTIENIYNNGYTTIIDFLNLTKIDLINTGKYKDKSADNILQGLQYCKDSLKNIKEYILMYSSGCFGFGLGSKKIKSILDVYPNIIIDYNDINKNEWIKNIKSVKGIDEQAEYFINNINQYKEFRKTIKQYLNQSIDN